MAGATETADHLVGDEQDAVLVTDALDLGPVAVGRNDDAASPLDRLADEGSHLVHPQRQDLLFQLTGTGQAELVGTHALPLTEVIGLIDVDYAGNGQTTLGVHALHAPQTGARHRGAVIGVVTADDHLLVGLPLAGPVVTHHAQHSVVALRARAGEEDVVEMGRRDLGQQGRQFGGGGMAGLEEEVVIGQLLHLSGGGIHQLLAAITQVDAPQARHPVQDAAPVGVFQIDPLGLGDDAAALLVQGLKVGEGMQVVAGIQLLPLAGGLLHCLLLGSFDVSDVY